MVAEAADLGGGGDPQARFDHAAEHHAEPEGPRRVGHAHRLADAAALRQLDVDAVRPSCALGDGRQGVHVLVDVDRERRGLLQPLTARVAGRQRLLDVLDAQRRQLRYRLERLVELPVLVHVHLERQVGDAAHGAHALDVEPVPAAELELQPTEARVHALRAAGHVVGVAEPDRPGGRRPAPLEAEQPPRRLARRACPQRSWSAAVDAPPSPPGCPGAPRAAGRSPRARTGRRRAAPPPRPGTPPRPRRSRRSGPAAAPRRSRETPSWAISTQRTSSSTVVSREIVKGSASRSVARRWVSFTPGTLSVSAPVAQGIERAPPEREVVGSIPTRRMSLSRDRSFGRTGWR